MRGMMRGGPNTPPFIPRGMPQQRGHGYPHGQPFYQMPVYMQPSMPPHYMSSPSAHMPYGMPMQNMNTGMGMGVNIPPQQSVVAPPQTREKRVLEIIDPKTGKPINVGGKSLSTSTGGDAEKEDEAKISSGATKDAPKKDAKKVVASPTEHSLKKKTPAAPVDDVSAEDVPDIKFGNFGSPVKEEKSKEPVSVKSPEKAGGRTKTVKALISPTSVPPKKEEPQPTSISPKKRAEVLPKKEDVAKEHPTPVSSTKDKASSIISQKSAPSTTSAPIPEKPNSVKIPKNKNEKYVYTVDFLIGLREHYPDLPELEEGKWPPMEIVSEDLVRGASSRSRPGGAGWERSGNPPLSRQSSKGSGGQWQRSQEVPKRGRGAGRGGKGGRGGQADVPEGPFKPLERSENRWIPTKSTTKFEAAQKKVQSIMNKMTREKFDRLAEQLTDINMESLEMLQGVIKIIFDKAVGEPHFCDMYADLCVHLEQKWRIWSFLKIVQNDDDKMFYWTTVSEADTEVVGPFDSASAAVESADSEDFEPNEAPENLKLSEVRVRQQKFIKIWVLEEESGSKFFWSGQHLDDLGDDQTLNGAYQTHEIASYQAIKACSFKRILLNACQEEFEKDNIYEELEEEFKVAKKEGKLTPETEADFEEKRIVMKGRMLGNIRFIGELYRKGMLQERIMHECIMKLMGTKVVVSGKSNEPQLLRVHPNDAPDEENIESLCKLLTTMGKDLERHGVRGGMGSYFEYLEKFSKDKRLCSRITFMIKDVIDLRNNRWEPRRKELQTKTLTEIRKEAEREHRAPTGQNLNRTDSFRSDRRAGSFRDSSSTRGAPMPQVYSQPASNRGLNKISIPTDRDRARGTLQRERDESVRTGPQGRPATFGKGTSLSRRGNAGAGGDSTDNTGGNSPSKGHKRETKDSSRAEPLSDEASEKIVKKAKSIAEEYVSIVDINEAEGCFNELETEFDKHPEVAALFTKEVLCTAAEAKEKERSLMFELIYKLSENKTLSYEGIRFGIQKLIELGVDLWCDVPRLHEHVAVIVVNFLKNADKTGISLDWLMSACGKEIESETLEELIEGGFLAEVCGQTLKLLKQQDLEAAKKEARNTRITYLSLLGGCQRSHKDLSAWVKKNDLDDVLPFAAVHMIVEKLLEATSSNKFGEWIETNVSNDLRQDSLFVSHVCLLILRLNKEGALPSSERCQLFWSFCCGHVDMQALSLCGIFQTMTDVGKCCLWILIISCSN
jgi:hypothetical protein